MNGVKRSRVFGLASITAIAGLVGCAVAPSEPVDVDVEDHGQEIHASKKPANNAPCRVDSQCDDGNPCTADLFCPNSGSCMHQTASNGTSCGGAGQCVWGACTSPAHADISAGQGAYSGMNVSALVDTTNGKLLVVTKNAANASKPALFRCNLDGTGCTYTDISAGQEPALDPTAVIDRMNGKLLVVAMGGTQGGPVLFRCNLDGTSCSFTDISVGQGPSSGSYPSAVIDPIEGKLLVATTNYSNGSRPSLFRCNLDGTSCTHSDISAGQGADTGYAPSAVIDVANRKLLVATNASIGNRQSIPALFRCNLDGTGCSYSDITAGQGSNTAYYPSAVIDTQNHKVLVVTRNYAAGERPSLFRCDLDGTNCTHADLSAGQGNGTGLDPSAVIDTVKSKLLVATTHGGNLSKPALFQCNLDGTGCTYVDISAGQGQDSGLNPSAVIDPIGRKVLVATTNGANLFKPSLFSMGY
jgi:hypothetical protein